MSKHWVGNPRFKAKSYEVGDMLREEQIERLLWEKEIIDSHLFDLYNESISEERIDYEH